MRGILFIVIPVLFNPSIYVLSAFCLKKLIEIKRLIDTIDFKKELSRFPTIDTSQLELDLNVYKPKIKTIKKSF